MQNYITENSPKEHGIYDMNTTILSPPIHNVSTKACLIMKLSFGLQNSTL